MKQIKTHLSGKTGMDYLNQLGGGFSVGTKVSYPSELKMKAVFLRKRARV
jgi:hypothetical protein